MAPNDAKFQAGDIVQIIDITGWPEENGIKAYDDAEIKEYREKVRGFPVYRVYFPNIGLTFTTRENRLFSKIEPLKVILPSTKRKWF